MKYAQFIEAYSKEKDTDISSHLPTIYKETLAMNPKIIVELGVRAGESSLIFHCVNQEIGSKVYGVDIVPCEYSHIYNGTFITMDDCECATIFTEKVDVLFIDTSHYYDHTKQEIAAWFPLLSEKALVIFHDTNIDGKGYWRTNNTQGENWDNERGVIRAIEEYFNRSFDEKTDFDIQLEREGVQWRLKHYTICNGLMCLWKNI